MRLKELRLGHANIYFGKSGGQTKTYKTADFGLNLSHHILLEGITFPPEKRSSMIQSLGPMTSLILYLLTGNDYRAKYKNAVIRAFEHIHHISAILDLIKDKKISEIRSIIEVLGNLAILMTPRQAQRMFPAPNIFVATVANTADILEFLPNFAWNRPFTFWGSYSKISSTGYGGALVYKHAMSRDKWTMGINMDSSQIQQIIFHCWFGTYKEDFGVLSSITPVNRWFTREELKDKFAKMSEQAFKEFKLLTIKYMSKMSTSSQTGILSGSNQQTASIPCFSGKRDRLFTGTFINDISKAKGRGYYVNTIPGALDFLTKLQGHFIRRINDDNNKQIDIGTTDWYKVENLTRLDEPPTPEIGFKVVETGRYYLSSANNPLS